MSKRSEQLNEAWGVLVNEFERAKRWRDHKRLPGLATALKIMDAVSHAEEFPQGDDRRVVMRLGEIVRQRDIFSGVLTPFEDDDKPLADAEAAAIEAVRDEPIVAAVLDRFPGAEVVDVRRREGDDA
jgi:hypothetical protein